MRKNIWEFLRKADGTYAVLHNDSLLADSIPERWREEEFCVRFGFCGQEYLEIVQQLDKCGKCTIDLPKIHP